MHTHIHRKQPYVVNRWDLLTGRRDNNKDNNLVAGRPWVLSVGSSISFVFIGVHPVSRQEEGRVRRREKKPVCPVNLTNYNSHWMLGKKTFFRFRVYVILKNSLVIQPLARISFRLFKRQLYIYATLSNDLPDEIRTYKYDCEVVSIANYRFVIVESRYERRGIVASSYRRFSIEFPTWRK